MMRQADHRKAINNATSLGRHLLAAIAVLLLTTVGAANADDAAVCRDTAVKKQWTRAVPACTAAAQRGDINAQAMLGLMYKDGEGVAQDYKQAVDWLTRAANQGEAYAQFSLGWMYRKGQGVAKDYKQAVRWHRLAAKQGLAEAQHNLGLMYAQGHGVAQNNVRAHMWFNLTAVTGLAEGVEARDLVASLMTREQIAEAQQMATDCAANDYKAC